MATHRAYVEPLYDEEPEPPIWERQSGVLAVYEAAPKPVWTTDPPQHPGVWWIRMPGHSGKVVDVFERSGRLFYSWTDIAEAAVPRDGLEWSNRNIVEPIG